MARIPTRSVSTSDRSKLQYLADRLKQVVFGQDDAIHSLVTAIKRSRAGLGCSRKTRRLFSVYRPHGSRENRGGQTACLVYGG